jgi:hypothetical protein
VISRRTAPIIAKDRLGVSAALASRRSASANGSTSSKYARAVALAQNDGYAAALKIVFNAVLERHAAANTTPAR